MANISTPFPLTSTPTSYGSVKSQSAAVLNDCNQVVLNIDGVGVAIHNIAPNRILKDYSVAPDVKFLCAPVCLRSDTQTTRTWVAYEQKGDWKLLCWTQTGVESSTDVIELESDKSKIRSLLPIDDSGESILVTYEDSRVQCYKRENSDALWTSEIIGSASHLHTFKAKDSPLTQNLDGFVLLAISHEARIYTISADAPPARTAISIPVNDPSEVSYTAFDVHSGTLFQLAKKELYVIKPNHEPTVCRLTNKYYVVYPLSTTHVLLTSRKDFVIYDIVYGIIQSRLEVPNSHTSIINTSNPSSFYAVSISENQAVVVPLTVPAASTLLDVVGKEHIASLSMTNPPVLLGPKRKVTSKEATQAVKELFQSLKTISEAKDSKAFDDRFKEFRKSYKANRGKDKKMMKLTPLFVKELLSLIFVNGDDGISIQVYPEKSLDFLLRVGLFSKDVLPDGVEQLAHIALGNPKFLNQLLKTEPTPFTYGDYLVLVKHILDNTDSPIVPPATILEAFERDVDKFFDQPDIKTILSNDELQLFLQVLTYNPETVLYPSLLATVLDTIGLGPLLLTQSLPTELFETLQLALDVESKSISNCLETSSALSLVLHRQNDLPLSKQRARDLLYGDGKRKLGQTGWVDMVAEEGGRVKKRNMWMKKPLLPGSGHALNSRFIAQVKTQEAPVYSLDRMII